MSLASGVSAGLSALAAAVKALGARVTTLEGRIKTVQITAADYAALGTPDTNTLYIVID